MLRFDLLDAIVLAFTRLTDPAKSFNKYSNASLQQLIDSLDTQSHSALAQLLQRHLANVRNKCERIEKWRDKWAAHRDLQAVLQPISGIGFSPAEVEEALAGLRAFMNEFERACQDPKAECVYLDDNKISSAEFATFVSESERLRIDPPFGYDKILFPDDGDTIIELLKRAKASALVSP